MANENIDAFVDYAAEYKSVLRDAKVVGDRITGRCPFHNDNRSSFTADLRTGKCHCFAGCIDGNFISFWAKLNGTDNREAYRQILQKYGRWEDPEQQRAQRARPQMQSFTLSEYAALKHLPEDFLQEVCRAETGKDRNGVQWLKLPYYNEAGDAPVFRKRYGNKEFRWSAGSSGKLILYGEWRLPEFREMGYVVLDEGESDTQTLWHLNVPAIGVPGASNFKASMVPKLDGLKIYIHVEPDTGGETFLSNVCRTLREEGFSGPVFSWSCAQFGVKDPSELFIRDGVDTAKKVEDALKNAQRIELNAIPEAIQGAPMNLRQPEGWIYSEKGISRIDEKEMTPVNVCRTPIILTRRLKSMDTGDEKIEIAFKRDGQWTNAVYPRSTIFTARGITVLADMGCTVTSENAKQVVSFLSALESENIDVIPKADSTSTFGWQSKGRFLPGHGDGIVLDIEPSLRGWAAAYHTNGTFDGWKAVMAPHRKRDKFRFILAASFTAPLLRILSQRIFFVYNWGSSKSGKSSGLKAALSAWGDPERLMVNFNATQVALERMAGFYNDLPLGIDERQLAGNKQDSLEKIVYMIASGTGRARGSKGGGLQALSTWRTVALATGEEPLSTETSQTGVSTRVLEIYGGPFTDEASASLMHQQSSMHYGWAGPEFIRHVMDTDERSITDCYERMTEDVRRVAAGTSGSHIAGISAVALADAMLETWIFDPEQAETASEGGTRKLGIRPEVWNRAVQMAQSILKEQAAAGVSDVNENATQYIVDWIISNRNYFGTNVLGTCLGTIDDDKAYIFPSILNQTLTKAGYSPRKTLKYWADNGIIAAKPDAGGKLRFSTPRRVGRDLYRTVEFDLGRFTREQEPEETPERTLYDEGEFVEVRVGADFPF